MKNKTFVGIVFLGFLTVLDYAAQVAPVAISPGRSAGVAVVAAPCPTFSWTSVDWAIGYRVAVFEAPGVGAVSYEQMTSGGAEPILSREIEGRGLSWTPSSEEGLRGERIYVWYVEAKSASGSGVWSAGRVFIVDTVIFGAGTEERVRRILRDKGIREDVITDIVKEARNGESGAGVSILGTQPQGDVGTMGTEGPSNTFYGLGAGASIVSGIEDTFIGRLSGALNTTGFGNTFLGHSAGYSNIGANANTFLGNSAGRSTTAGGWNTFVGSSSGWSNVSGTSNTFLGYYSGYQNVAGSSNVFLGFQAGYNETGSNKLYIANSNTTAPLVYGEFNNSLLAVNGKLGIGTQAPAYPMELKTTGRNATFVLQRSDGGAINFINATSSYGQFGTGNNYPVRILVNTSWRMSLNTDNSLTMANGASCTAGGVWTNASSRELKENIEELGAEEAEAALAELLPVTYNYKVDKSERHVGFIAEDVPALVASKDRKTVSPMDVVAVLTKVVQEQQKTFFGYQQSLLEQQKTIAQLKDAVAKIEKTGMREK